MTRARWIGTACLGASIVLSAIGQLGMKAGMQNLKLARAGGEIAWSLAVVAAAARRSAVHRRPVS